MNVLLDTCALLALARGDLPRQAANALSKSEEAQVSIVSPWEVALKSAGGKLHLSEPVFQWFAAMTERYSLRPVPLEARIACAAAELPLIHKDPFDRILVALAQSHSLPILTSDKNIPKYAGIKTIW